MYKFCDLKKTDYIIVGLGLAGACLALQLRRRGKGIVVYDTPSENRASAVAAGLFNPITGKRIVKTWMADQLFPFLRQFYQEEELRFGTQFFYPTPLYTPFRSIEEQNDWMAKSIDSTISPYVIAVHTKSTFGDQVNDPLGGILLHQCGHVNVPTLLECVRDELKKEGNYTEKKFEDNKLIVEKDYVVYDDVKADKIIFCTGVHQLQSSIFFGLPLKPLKGEVITINTSPDLNRIYNRGIYVVAHEKGTYKVGATYSLENTTPGITQEGKNELVDKVSDLLAQPFTVCHQDWGIRPSTVDRRPLIGEHPTHKNILIFNGLGTKGVTLAPYFSDQLAKYLDGKGNLEREANINRVKSLYSKF